MADLRRCFEAAGFSDVRTLLSSGNVAFSTRTTPAHVLERRAEQAMLAELGHSFRAIVRSTEHLQALVASDPFAEFALPPSAKRVVTFLRRPAPPPVALPVERDGARILKLAAAEAFTAYVPSAKGPVFMALLQRTFGADVTTRTLDTVGRCARA
jgi:uncharacterized protein (DUF1697 family)